MYFCYTSFGYNEEKCMLKIEILKKDYNAFIVYSYIAGGLYLLCMKN